MPAPVVRSAMGGGLERMPPAELGLDRMLTPQAHPMNDGLSLPPSWGRFMPCDRNEPTGVAVAELFWQ
jgi:hypothetical protein